MKRTLIALAATLAAGAALAQYPAEKPITIVVPFAAGGVTDFVGRLVGKKMGDHLKQTVIVENAPCLPERI